MRTYGIRPQERNSDVVELILSFSWHHVLHGSTAFSMTFEDQHMFHEPTMTILHRCGTTVLTGFMLGPMEEIVEDFAAQV